MTYIKKRGGTTDKGLYPTGGFKKHKILSKTQKFIVEEYSVQRLRINKGSTNVSDYK